MNKEDNNIDPLDLAALRLDQTYSDGVAVRKPPSVRVRAISIS